MCHAKTPNLCFTHGEVLLHTHSHVQLVAVSLLEGAQALVHADVPQLDGLVHGCRQNKLGLGPTQLQHILLVPLIHPVGLCPQDRTVAGVALIQCTGIWLLPKWPCPSVGIAAMVSMGVITIALTLRSFRLRLS